jgi:hypothetical protein
MPHKDRKLMETKRRRKVRSALARMWKVARFEAMCAAVMEWSHSFDAYVGTSTGRRFYLILELETPG